MGSATSGIEGTTRCDENNIVCVRVVQIEGVRADAQERMNRAAWNALALHYQREVDGAERPPTANPQDTLLTKVGYFPPSCVSIFWEGDSKVRALNNINENTPILMELPSKATVTVLRKC